MKGQKKDVDDKVVKDRIMDKYGYIDKSEDGRYHRPTIKKAVSFLGYLFIAFFSFFVFHLCSPPYQKIRTSNLLKKVKAYLVLFATNVQFRSPYTYSHHKVKKYKF